MYGPVYSVDNSIGLIMATGNVGYYLATRSDEINTYLSRDGGMSWFEVKFISYFEFFINQLFFNKGGQRLSYL